MRKLSAWMVYDRIAARLDPNYRRLPGEEGGVMVKPNLTSMENVLAWAQGYGDKRVGTNVKTDHETATYLAECVHLRQAFEQQERWRAGEAYDGINHERDIEQLRAAIKADKPHE